MDKNTEIILKSVVGYIINNFEKSTKIIDLGCGRAYIVQELIRKGFQYVYGLDVKDQREFTQFQFLDNIDLCTPYWSEKVINNFDKFDLAIATEVIEHLTNPYIFFK